MNNSCSNTIFDRTRHPDFLIVGAAKSGTTSLMQYLSGHPDIFMPPEESNPLAQMDHADRTDLISDFRSTQARMEVHAKRFINAEEPVIGEKSPAYLYYHERAGPNIRKWFGENTRIIILLRNPVDRAFSGYKHMVKRGEEPFSFIRGLDMEAERIAENKRWAWRYTDIGFYSDQVGTFLNLFPNVKIFLFDDLVKDPRGVYSESCRFLGLDPDKFMPNTNARYNTSSAPKNTAVHRFIFKQFNTRSRLLQILKPVYDHLWTREQRQLIRQHINALLSKKFTMDDATRRRLTELYREDILKLQDMIHRDLTFWLNHDEHGLSGDSRT